MRTSARIIITTCSATLIELQYVTSATVMPFSIAAWRSVWSEPMPAVMIELQLLRLVDALRGHVGRPERLRDDDLGVGQLLLEAREFGPSLSEVTTSVWPAFSRNLRRPSSPETLPSSCAGLEVDGASGVGAVWPSG